MQAASKNIIDLERKFWQSMVDEDTDTALAMLDEPSLMVSSHGAMQFDHDKYRQMAEHGTMVIKSFELSDMNVVFPTEQTAVLTYHVKQALAERGKSKLTHQEMADSSVWMHKGGKWVCVMHTETPVDTTSH
ncbi:nuclear transport factor 2 family protein [Piscinibacter terrae]|uniref:Nuclear transport factor 2 family protein n=1 Tax=Piscinibacter terrae TaxID=2496871 RepID=A0A3N7HMG0_9BURK|nr:nuclear transport factor 2 family protein [Albitalea terrae]RQP22803.1 nuclear transport factor 2 family protein [Albitalea terrae]